MLTFESLADESALAVCMKWGSLASTLLLREGLLPARKHWASQGHRFLVTSSFSRVGGFSAWLEEFGREGLLGSLPRRAWTAAAATH